MVRRGAGRLTALSSGGIAEQGERFQYHSRVEHYVEENAESSPRDTDLCSPDPGWHQDLGGSCIVGAGGGAVRPYISTAARAMGVGCGGTVVFSSHRVEARQAEAETAGVSLSAHLTVKYPVKCCRDKLALQGTTDGSWSRQVRRRRLKYG